MSRKINFRGMGGRYDTPTDGISRKMFDRAMDKHIRRYAILAERVAALERLVRYPVKVTGEEE